MCRDCKRNLPTRLGSCDACGEIRREMVERLMAGEDHKQLVREMQARFRAMEG